MADDVQPITGTSARVAARLCNFATGQSALLPTHVAWLEANVRPALAGVPAPWVDLWGYASHLGNAASNQALSAKRCEAVRLAVKAYSPTVTFPQEWGKGEAESGGGANNNDGYWRAVEIYVYGVKPPIRPRPPKPNPNKSLRDLILAVSAILENLAEHIPGGGAVLKQSGVKLPKTVRLLTADEQTEAQTIYKGSLDFTKIFITDGLGAEGRPFTLALQDKTLGWVVVLNMGDAAPWNTRPRSETLIHELAHAWQSQHHPDHRAFMGNSVKSQAQAMADNAMAKLLRLGYTADPYYYVPGKPFGTYGAEQIAWQVEHVYMGRSPTSRPVVTTIASVAPNAPSADNEASLATAKWERSSAPGCVTR